MPDDMMTPEEISALRAERDRLVAERDAAQRRADEEASRADGLSVTVTQHTRQIAESHVAGLTAQEQQAESAINAATTELANLKGQYAALMAEGKFEDAAEIQEKIGDATARRQQAQQARVYYRQQADAAKAAPVDPIDRFLAQNPAYTDAEREWIKKNPRYATDQKFHQRVNEAHNRLVNGGVERFSADYFKGLEDAGYMRGLIGDAHPAVPRGTGGVAQAHADPGEGDPDNPYSSAAGDEPDVVIEEPAVPPTPVRPAAPAARAPAAAAPSRRAAPAPAGRPQAGRVVLSPEQAQAALAMSEYFPEEVQNGGEAEIYAYYHKLYGSPMAQRLRENWAAGG